MNSLTGELIDAGISALAPGGRFVEIGKLDIRTPDEIAAMRPDVEYTAIDLIDKMRDEPAELIEKLATIFAEIAAGRLAAVPHRTHRFSEAKTAFRDLAGARHMGKLVLVPDVQAPLVRRDGSYIVTGGTSGVGFAVAEWLARNGARSVRLLSRRPPTPEIANKIEAWRATGVDISAVQGDVNDENCVHEIVETLDDTLRGVVHCANVLDDAPVVELTPERFATVMRPKAVGAWNLHNATREAQLDFFLLFSSWASIAGTRGGANYAAANMVLDGLAHQRRHEQLPALSINWGTWDEIGWAVRSPGAATKRAGFRAMRTDEAIAAMELALRANAGPQIAIAPVNWPALLADGMRGGAPSVFKDFATPHGLVDTGAPTGSLPSIARLIADTAAADVRRVLVARLQTMAAAALGIGESGRIDPDQPLQDLGMDSILAVDLRNSISRSLEVETPATLLFDFPTIHRLAEYSLNLRRKEPGEPSINVPEDDGLLAMIEALSDTEVEERLAGKRLEILAMESPHH